MVVVWTIGRLFQPLGLPIVFGELIGGIIVGPMLLNLVSPDSEVIHVIAELGIFFLMLHTGLKTQHQELLGASLTAIIVGVMGSIIPFLGGFGIGIWYGLDTLPSVFLGIGLSASAIAMAARLFKETGIANSRVAHITIGAAVIEDIIALVLFSLVLAYNAEGSVNWMSFGQIILEIALFFGIVLWFGLKSAPYLHKYLAHGKKSFTLTLIVALLFGYIAELIGLHSIIGAFLAGLFMQEELLEPSVYAKIEDRFYGLAYSFFGPVFFASLAFYLDFSAVLSAPVFTALVILIAIVGKFIGCSGTALLLKIPKKESLLIGMSMNNRGAVELVIAAIGLQQGVIDGVLFSILVTMAFVTTVLSILLTPRFIEAKAPPLAV